MSATRTCGEALVDLLEKYDVDTVFGIPGVHTLDLYRGLASSAIQHIQTRHEQGAAFMADGYARASGKPGVCFLISGPGVTNGLTALGQSWADSVPVLCISSDAASYTLGKGWGVLHEVPSLTAVTAPLTSLSATAMRPSDVPELIGQAFSHFAAQRPRPIHIAIPLDVLAMPVDEEWQPVTPPTRPQPHPKAIEQAAQMLAEAKRPLLFIGGGGVEAANPLTQLAERLNASVVSSNAGKGIVPESHPHSVGGGVWRKPVQQHIAEADCILAIGTELSETDSFIDKYEFNGRLIRVDIDPRKLNDQYPADVGIIADAAATATALLAALEGKQSAADWDVATAVQQVKTATIRDLSRNEAQHVNLLNCLREVLPDDTIIAGDIAQLVYTGSFAMPVEQPRLWHYPAGFCTLGCGLPNAVGAKLALPEQPVIVLAGDGGFMFTVNDLITAAELHLPIPIIIWENGGLLQIKEDMEQRNIEPVGVNGINPDFLLLAQAMGCYGTTPKSMEAFATAVTQAFTKNRPTVIVVEQDAPWLV